MLSENISLIISATRVSASVVNARNCSIQSCGFFIYTKFVLFSIYYYLMTKQVIHALSKYWIFRVRWVSIATSRQQNINSARSIYTVLCGSVLCHFYQLEHSIDYRIQQLNIYHCCYFCCVSFVHIVMYVYLNRTHADTARSAHH